MNHILVALAQMNPAVGALAANRTKIVQFAAEAAAQGAGLVVFPELSISGYPPEDLVLKEHFLADCETQVQALAKNLPHEPVVVVGVPLKIDGKRHNCAVILQHGEIKGTYRKILLPNYGVFDEKRVFDPGDRTMMMKIGGASIGIHICEDSWSASANTCLDFKDAGLDALINLSASPYQRGKQGLRENILTDAATNLKTHVLYCNLIGGQDELVFDGASMALSPEGKLVARARPFEEDILYFDVPTGEGTAKLKSCTDQIILDAPEPSSTPAPTSEVTPALDDCAEVYAALKLGLRDYVEKCGFNNVLVALSGGIDSAIVAAIAVDALGKKRVTCVTMPSQYSSDDTFNDAIRMAKNLGVEIHTVPIKGLYDAYIEQLGPIWAGQEPDITEENIQARIRGGIIMALSNKFGSLVLATGNKSEMATGYCTLYGDMVGGFAVIKDVPKTLVFELSRWRNAQQDTPFIPPSIIERPPSAELRPDQKDTDSLPPYDLLDAILERYVEQDMGIDAIVADGFDADIVIRVAQLVDRSEYKRRQGAPGIKITHKAFGRDRRIPITNQYRNHP